MGHTYVGSLSITYTTDIENWNEAHPDQQINIAYSEEDLAKQFQNLQAGGAQYDFATVDKPMYDGYYQPEFDLDLKEVPLRDEEDKNLNSYFIFS